MGVILPDGATVHTAFLAAEKAGLVVVGVGSRAGQAEIRHLLRRTGATALLTHEHHQERPAGELVASLRAESVRGLRHIVVPDVAVARSGDGGGRRDPRPAARRRRGGPSS